jgi:hypothetical protein
MKIYKSEKINHLSNVFDNFKPFDEVDIKECVPLYDSIDDYIKNNLNLNNKQNNDRFQCRQERRPTHPTIMWQNDNAEYFTSYRVDFIPEDEYNNPSVEKIWRNGEFTDTYSIVKKEKYKLIPSFVTGLVQDARFLSLKSVKKLVYLEFPKEVLLEYMTNFSAMNDDYDEYQFPKMMEFVKEVESSGGWRTKNWITIMYEFDKKYPDTVVNRGFKPGGGRPPFYYSWRLNFFVEWFLSVRDFGIGYPLISSPSRYLPGTLTHSHGFFNGGIHRLTNNTLCGYNMPFFLRITDDNLRQTKLKCVTPKYFGGKHLLLEIDLIDETILFSLIKDASFEEVENNKQIIGKFQ